MSEGTGKTNDELLTPSPLEGGSAAAASRSREVIDDAVLVYPERFADLMEEFVAIRGGLNHARQGDERACWDMMLAAAKALRSRLPAEASEAPDPAAASRSREVTHNDQLEVWAEELTFALMEWLKEPETYDDKVHMASAMKAKIKRIVDSAFVLAESSRLPAEASEEPDKIDFAPPTYYDLLDALAQCREAIPDHPDTDVERASAAILNPLLVPDLVRKFVAAAGWHDISTAPRDISVVMDLCGVTLRHSYPIWAREKGCEPRSVSWCQREAENPEGYWWDWDAEEPIHPVEWLPHPLDRAMLTASKPDKTEGG